MDDIFDASKLSADDEPRLRGMRNAMTKLMDLYRPGWHNDPSTEETHMRFVKYLLEFNQPFPMEKVFGSTFQVQKGHHSMVIQRKIPFRMICEHHLLPAMGEAFLGYVPADRVLGLSKLTRLVQAVGVGMPSLQEHIADRICDLMDDHLRPKGTMLVIRAEHGCMACRGVNSPGVDTVTSVVRGVFRDNHVAREEFLSLIKG